MTYEDFTTYTEVDPNSHITKTANHIDHYAIRNEDAYLYADKGASHFTNFTHLVQVQSDFHYTSSSGLGVVWMLSNDLDDFYGLQTNNKTFILMCMQSSSSFKYIALYEGYGGTLYSSSWTGAAANTPYYLKIEKSGTSLTCKIYSDSARTNLLTTLSLTLHGNWNFRYVFGCDSYNNGGSYYCNNDIDNLDLGEGVNNWQKTCSEIIGCLDTYSSKTGYIRTLLDKIGGLDSKTRLTIRYRTISDNVGESDVKFRTVTLYRSYLDKIGILDTMSKIKTLFRTLTDKIGNLDILNRILGRIRIFSELLGLVDTGKVRIRGVTKDSNGNPLGNCSVKCFRASDDSLITTTTSDVDGNYSIDIPMGYVVYLVAFKQNEGWVEGTTDPTINK